MYQGSDGCSHVYATDKATLSGPVLFDFSTAVASDPNFRDEGLTCDPNTFASQGKQVMWSKEAYSPMRAHAYEIPAGSCGFGGAPATTGFMTGGGKVTNQTASATFGFELFCSTTSTPNNLQVNWGKGNKFHLDKLTGASCTNNPAITPNPPAAGFDTYSGSGSGRYNGTPGATAQWTLTSIKFQYGRGGVGCPFPARTAASAVLRWREDNVFVLTLLFVLLLHKALFTPIPEPRERKEPRPPVFGSQSKSNELAIRPE